MFISGHSGHYHPHNTFAAQRNDTSSTVTRPEEQTDVSSGDDKDKDEIEVNKVSRNQSPSNTAVAEKELHQAEIKQLRELRTRDREVRAHEQAHAAVAGSTRKRRSII